MKKPDAMTAERRQEAIDSILLSRFRLFGDARDAAKRDEVADSPSMLAIVDGAVAYRTRLTAMSDEEITRHLQQCADDKLASEKEYAKGLEIRARDEAREQQAAESEAQRARARGGK